VSEEARSLLAVQDAVIKQFDRMLEAYVDFPSMKSFREFIRRYKVRS